MLGLSSTSSRFTFYALGLVIGCAAVACSDDDSDDGAAAGAAGQASAGAGGSSGGNAGASGAGGSAGTGGTAGAAGAAGAGGSGAESDAGTGNFVLSSSAFASSPAGCGPDNRDACSLFQDDNTGLGDARNVSPELSWTGAPAGTQSFAIALHDLVYMQAPPDPFTHWVMWNIPASSTGLPAELPAGTEPGVPAAETRQVSFRDNDAFAGSGACGNVYEFVLFALDVDSFDPPDDSSGDAVEAALAASDAVLGTTTLRARSNPDGPSCNN
jgi:phosphatidylethanolamine-binding protein (PEBP) family uncharacterized protein